MIAPADTASPVTAAPTDRSEQAGEQVDLQRLLDAVTELDANASDAVLIDRIAALERLKSGCAAAQVRLTATFTASQTADATARKHRPDAARRSIAGQVALARHDSPHAGRRHVGVAAALVGDMPYALAALSSGDLSERRAHIIVEQLACLTPTDRREADRLLAPDMPSMGDRSAQTRSAAMACRLDPEAVLAKIRGAVKDRHVGIRPAPEEMGRLSALLPVTMAVAVYAALSTAAGTATAAPGGDPRNRGQLMADALVSAVTGHTITGCDPYGVPQYAPAAAPTTDDSVAPEAADAAPATANTASTDDEHTDVTTAVGPGTAGTSTASTSTASTIRTRTGCTGGCGISINLVMTDRTLLDCDDEPAHLTGYGPIPGALARALVIGSADTTTRTFIRRLYTDPVSGQLATMDTRRRLFPAAAQRFLLARDQTCRTPWCDAPIREYDHLQPHAAGGPTTTHNGRGVCKACNLTKEAHRWISRSADGTTHLTVPTGHTYTSTAPPPPRSQPWADISHTERLLATALLWTAAAA